MLKPAILFKEEIQNYFKSIYYTEEMMFVSGGMENWLPDIVECPEENLFQYAIIDNNKNLIGYVSFKVNWYDSAAYNFGLISFDKGNINIGFAMKEVIDKIANEFHLHSMEWRVVGGNPVEDAYDRFCKKFNGHKHIINDANRDMRGNYRYAALYEIIFGETLDGCDKTGF